MDFNIIISYIKIVVDRLLVDLGNQTTTQTLSRC